MIRSKLNYWISAAFLLLFGILFIILGTKYEQKVLDTLDIILGVLFLIEGSAAILVSILLKKRFVSPLSLTGAVSLSLGIFCLVKTFIDTFLVDFLDFVPYLLVVVGSLMLLQALLTYFLSKNKNLVTFIIQLAYAGIILAFGILCLTVFDKRETKFIILGAILCVYATYVVIGSFMPELVILSMKEANLEPEDNEEAQEVEVMETEVNNSNEEKDEE